MCLRSTRLFVTAYFVMSHYWGRSVFLAMYAYHLKGQTSSGFDTRFSPFITLMPGKPRSAFDCWKRPNYVQQFSEPKQWLYRPYRNVVYIPKKKKNKQTNKHKRSRTSGQVKYPIDPRLSSIKRPYLYHIKLAPDKQALEAAGTYSSNNRNMYTSISSCLNVVWAQSRPESAMRLATSWPWDSSSKKRSSSAYPEVLRLRGT